MGSRVEHLSHLMRIHPHVWDMAHVRAGALLTNREEGKSGNERGGEKRPKITYERKTPLSAVPLVVFPLAVGKHSLHKNKGCVIQYVHSAKRTKGKITESIHSLAIFHNHRLQQTLERRPYRHLLLL